MSSKMRHHSNHCWIPCAFPIPEPPQPKIYSAFRAIRTGADSPTITVDADANVQVLYENEQYDLMNEYTPLATITPTIPSSTFIPKNKGIYSIIASAEFTPTTEDLDYVVTISIIVNDTTIVASNNVVFNSTVLGNRVVFVSTHIQLNSGDTVQVFLTSTEAGTIASIPATSHFEATRLPSPTI